MVISGIYTVKTGIAPDTTAPVILSGGVAEVTQNSATIEWVTDEPATSQLEYGLTASYGSQTAVSNTFVTAHSVTINGLNPGTLYYYRAKSADAAGNLVVSGQYTFTTLSDTAANEADTAAPTRPNGLKVTVVSPYQIDLNWNPSSDNVGVAGYLVYRDNVQIAVTETTSFADDALEPKTTYYYTVAAIDAAGNTSARSFRTRATTLSLAQINQAPLAEPDNFSTMKNIKIMIPVEDLMVNDSDPEDHALSVTRIFGAKNGRAGFLRDSGKMTVVFAPKKDFVGTAQFNYTLRDELGKTAVGLVLVDVTATEMPAANDVTLSAQKNIIKEIHVNELLENDSDPQDQNLAVYRLNSAKNVRASFAVKSGKTLIKIVPKKNYIGPASFTYMVTNESGDRSTATVHIDIQ
jgi:chitodextrinase